MKKPTSAKMKANQKTLTHKAGDLIEKAGKQLSKMGATKLGKKVYTAGNKLEHSKDRK